MGDTQLTILGMSGSGKTCYLLGLYYKMVAGLKGYTLKTDDDTDVLLRDRYTKLSDTTLEYSERFPAGTDNVIKYKFDLQYGYKTIMSFDWVDYPGGLLDRKVYGDLEAYESIKSNINTSSCLFICVDGELLCSNDFDEKVDKIRDNCSHVINSFFSDYFNENKKLPPTAILITKYDICQNDTDEDELCEVIMEAFSPFFVSDDLKKIVAIIPVSLGTDLVGNYTDAKIKPLNVNLPIYMGISFALEEKCRQHMVQINKQSDSVQKKLSDLLYDKTEEENSFFLFRSSDRINRLAREIENLKDKSKKDLEQLHYLLRGVHDTRTKLIKELGKITHVYCNGKEASFSELFELEDSK